jgi:hypothetical protein
MSFCHVCHVVFLQHTLTLFLVWFFYGNRKIIRRPYRGVVTRWNSDYDEVKATNIFMGDLQRSLVIMLEDDGCDAKLLRDTDNKIVVDKTTMMFTPSDQMMLRQYECAAEPVVLLSKFFQLDKPTSHLVLIHLRARIQQMRETRFTMYEEISHLKMPILTNRRRTETVLAPEVKDWEDYGRVEPMLFPVDQFRALFCDDLEIRCGLVVEDEKDESLVHHVDELPSDIAVACLLNPLVGGMSYLYWREQPIAVTNFSCLY